ncbi:MAG TPA: glycosyltransferase family 2 protein [Hyphomonadaceae bacterium]|nr:glycosyltransferase family 2 protein [Hyphomonadaceae bacterium]HPN07035.1 glycosyltransferase family 2 protein [Hyphomonadaceae bacterium]
MQLEMFKADFVANDTREDLYFLPPEIAIVAPTFNERDNVIALKNLIADALKGRTWELIFVDDDSTDGTFDVVSAESRRDPRVRIIRRVGRRGLATAVVEGILSTTAPMVAVIDADMQHDERVIPDMIARMKQQNVDLVIGSRYVNGGGVGEWDAKRQTISRIATDISRLVVKADLTDPMSGFFLIRRKAFDSAVRNLSGQGYKILLDIVASAKPPLKIAEVPYTFRNRQHGDSKLDSAVTWEYLMLVADKLIGRFVPIRFLMFMAVGGAGVVVHMSVLAAMFELAHQGFAVSQGVAAAVAMTFNFFVNNFLTYRDKRRKGWGMLTGLLSFYAVCSIGAVANVGIAGYLFSEHYAWWLSGIAGILVGAVWNYAASSLYTWKK